MIRRSFMKQYLADFGLLFVGIFWGLGFVFVKIGLNTGVDPFYLSTVRFLVGGIILYGIFFRKVGKFKKNDVLAGLIVGIFQFFGYAFQTYGAMLTTASKNAFFTSINVIIVPYIFWFLHKKRPDIFAFLASVICVMGVAVISFDRKMNLANLNFGDILTIISAIFFAGQIATNGYFSKKVEPLKLVVMQMFVAGILFVVNIFIFSDTSKIQKPAGMMLIAIIYLTIFSTTIPTVLQTFCQKYTTSTRASVLMSTESLFAPLFAFFILSERLSLRVAIGAGLVLFAVLVSETKLGFRKLID